MPPIPADIAIVPWRALTAPDRFAPALDDIFFGASATTSFTDRKTQDEFHHRWLGRYFEHDRDWIYIALTPSETLAGYLVGCTQDPALTPRFSDIAYFQTYRHLTARFPAHLHINLAPQFRNHGIGGLLVSAFVRDLDAIGSPGVHVVTGLMSKSIPFYNRNGFQEVGRIGNGDAGNVFLGRTLKATV